MLIKTVFKCAEAGFWAETLPLGWSDITPLPHYESYYPGTEEAHTNPTRQRGERLRALAGASG